MAGALFAQDEAISNLQTSNAALDTSEKIDRFRLLSKIGEGTYGVVFLGRDSNYPTPSP